MLSQKYMKNAAKLIFSHQGVDAALVFSGVWSMSTPQPDISGAMNEFRTVRPHRLALDVHELEQWDSSLLVVLVRFVRYAQELSISVAMDNLPQDLQRLLQMALATPDVDTTDDKQHQEGFFARIGGAVLAMPETFNKNISFLGEVAISCKRFFRGRADMRGRDFLRAVQECGSEALPIVSVTSLLFGLILAFVGAVQLMQFGAQIYVAGLVGIGMLRVMGAVMVGVVMSGRMGAAYAALIGTMQVNEEVDALSTFGMSPIDFLVLPRILALTLMTPLLTLYADFMGLVGGFLVGVCMLGISPMEYINATTSMVGFKQVAIGLVYGTVFGVIVALAGCYQGIQCGRSAEAVGKSTTAAVVNSIMGIIIATAIITVLCNALGV